MKRWRFTLVTFAAFALALLAGCSTPVLKSQVTTFQDWPNHAQDKTYVFERTKDQDNNLEYRNYENLVRAELARLGFTEAPDLRSARLKATISYGISGRDVRVSYPVMMNPSWYGPAWRGYYGPFYDPFWYGPPVVERREENYQVFTREFRFVLARMSDGRTVYDTRVVSEGTNGSLAAVMPYMVKAAFTDFPAKNGETRVVELKMK